MIRITNEIIQTAKHVDLPNFLLRNGEHLKKNGKYSYTLLNHDSLVISLSDRGFWVFFWNSRNTQGDAIKFIIDYYNVDFKQAVSMLTGQAIYKFNPFDKDNSDLIPKVQSVNLQLSEDMRRVFAYLIKSRCIDAKLVQYLVKEKLLYQDKKGNAVFPFYNDNKSIVGAELHGTLTTVRFKGILSDSQYGYGFSVAKGTPKAIYCFESALDLASFMSLKKDLNNSLFLSLAGLKAEILHQTLIRYPSLQDVYICTDNDQAGQNFAQAVKMEMNCEIIVPPIGKDWNEYLKFKVNNPDLCF